MTKPRLGLTILALTLAKSAAAEPCVSNTFDEPLQGAVEVVTRHADVPSPQFPGLWQEGMLDGLFYTLYANGEGVVKSEKRISDWEVRVLCLDHGVDCSISATGTPPENAYQVANILSLCLRNVAPAEPEKPKTTKQPEVSLKTPCGLASVEDGAGGIVLQRLLVAAGADPGPVDGYVGGKTNEALAGILGEESTKLSIADAIGALDLWMCDNQN
ncbi:peptidoglycan-binding domain-containing protein [Sulfitobacter sp.]|jgi:hypothetical protein|uniref:peptidoglycan-binding domain-containing protein n=1 Tax=Sulfitobacter sp. TaxID=1903071 RepID=UPI003EF6D197